MVAGQVARSAESELRGVWHVMVRVRLGSTRSIHVRDQAIERGTDHQPGAIGGRAIRRDAVNVPEWAVSIIGNW